MKNSPNAQTNAFHANNFSGILWLLASVVSASAMALGVRELAGEIDSRAIVFYRALITFFGALIILHFTNRLKGRLRYSRPGLHLFRGIAIGVSTHLGFYALTNMPLVTATVLFFTAPIFATIFAIPIHREVPGPRRLAAIAVGFVGVIVVLRPDLGTLDLPTIAALASSLLFAVALVISREVAEADGTLSVFLSSLLITTVISIPIALPVMALPATSWPLFILSIVIAAGAVRGYADIQAYRVGEAAVLAPFAYLRIVIIGLGAFFFFGEIPERAALIGAAIIILAAVYIAQRERAARRLKT